MSEHIDTEEKKEPGILDFYIIKGVPGVWKLLGWSKRHARGSFEHITTGQVLSGISLKARGVKEKRIHTLGDYKIHTIFTKDKEFIVPMKDVVPVWVHEGEDEEGNKIANCKTCGINGVRVDDKKNPHVCMEKKPIPVAINYNIAEIVAFIESYNRSYAGAANITDWDNYMPKKQLELMEECVPGFDPNKFKPYHFKEILKWYRVLDAWQAKSAL